MIGHTSSQNSCIFAMKSASSINAETIFNTAKAKGEKKQSAQQIKLINAMHSEVIMAIMTCPIAFQKIRANV